MTQDPRTSWLMASGPRAFFSPQLKKAFGWEVKWLQRLKEVQSPLLTLLRVLSVIKSLKEQIWCWWCHSEMLNYPIVIGRFCWLSEIQLQKMCLRNISCLCLKWSSFSFFSILTSFLFHLLAPPRSLSLECDFLCSGSDMSCGRECVPVGVKLIIMLGWGSYFQDSHWPLDIVCACACKVSRLTNGWVGGQRDAVSILAFPAYCVCLRLASRLLCDTLHHRGLFYP